MYIVLGFAGYHDLRHDPRSSLLFNGTAIFVWLQNSSDAIPLATHQVTTA